MSAALSYMTRCGRDAAVLWCDGQKDLLACTWSSPPSAWATQCHASAGITVVGILDSQGLFLKSATSFTSVLSAGLGEQCDSEVSSPSLGSVWHRDIQDDQRIRGTLWDGLGISVWSLLTLQGQLRFIRILLTPSQHKLCQTWTDSEALLPCDPQHC